MVGTSFVKPNIDKTLYLWSKNAKKDFNGAGVVNSISLDTAGSGYTSLPSVVLDAGYGDKASAVASCVVNNINITNAGDYLDAPSVVLQNGGGTGATAVIGMSISGIQREIIGSGYTSAPTIEISAPNIAGGTQATAYTSIANEGLNFIVLTNGGSGYTSPPTITISGGGGTGATATAILGTSVVGSVTIPVGGGGSGYSGSGPGTFTGGGGSGASAWIFVSGGSITQVTILRCGSGYTSPPTLTLEGKGGSGAVLQVVLSKPVITHIPITNAGSGYTSSPDVVFTGGVSTTQATAIATLRLSNLQITNQGSGYTSAPNVSITGGGGTGATATTTINYPANFCYNYKWEIPEITLNECGEISMEAKAYNSFTPSTTAVSTRIKNVSSKYNYDTANGGGTILNIGHWGSKSKMTKCPPIPLQPQSINEISLSFTPENNTEKGLESSADFVVVLKITEDDVPPVEWGNSKAVNVRQLAIPTYN